MHTLGNVPVRKNSRLPLPTSSREAAWSSLVHAPSHHCWKEVPFLSPPHPQAVSTSLSEPRGLWTGLRREPGQVPHAHRLHPASTRQI